MMLKLYYDGKMLLDEFERRFPFLDLTICQLAGILIIEGDEVYLTDHARRSCDK